VTGSVTPYWYNCFKIPKKGCDDDGRGHKGLSGKGQDRPETILPMIMTFLEWIIAWFFADHLASRQEEARERGRLEQEIEDLRSEIESLKTAREDGKE